MEAAILNLKREKPYWGRLLRRFSCEVKVPARSTIHAVLMPRAIFCSVKPSGPADEGWQIVTLGRGNVNPAEDERKMVEGPTERQEPMRGLPGAGS